MTRPRGGGYDARMRAALVAGLVLILIGAAAACSAFSGTDEEKKPAATDAGIDAPAACAPPVREVGDAGATGPDPTVLASAADNPLAVTGLVTGNGVAYFLVDNGRLRSVGIATLSTVADFGSVTVNGALRRMSFSENKLYFSTADEQAVVDIDRQIKADIPEIRNRGLPLTGLAVASAKSLYYAHTASDGQNVIARFIAGAEPDIQVTGVVDLLATRGDDVFWTETVAGEASIRGPHAEPKKYATVPSGFVALAAEADQVYFVDEAQPTHVRRVRAGEEPVTVAIAPSPVTVLAAANDSVYFVTKRPDLLGELSEVVRVSRCGGPAVVLLEDSTEIRAVAVDADALVVGAGPRVLRTDP